MLGLPSAIAHAPRLRAVPACVLALVLVVGLVVAVPSLHPRAAQAQSAVAEGGAIDGFEVRGNQRVEEQSVLAQLGLSEGDPFSAESLDAAFKRLFATNLFREIDFSRQEDVLIITVQENPIISRINFEKNKRIADEALAQEVPLRERDVFTPALVRRSVERLELIYQRRGLYEAVIRPQIIERDQNRVDLVFEIQEGKPVQIRSVNFIGNDAYSDRQLRRNIATRTKSLLRLFSSSDVYDPERLSFDGELLRRYYESGGYPEFQVISATAEYLSQRRGFAITFVVEEGPEYQFGEVALISESGDLDAEAFRKDITVKPGKQYDATRIEETADILREKVAEQGFAFVEISTDLELDRVRRIAEVSFILAEGSEVYVERIDIEGNLRTLDRVVRREFRLTEGDPYDLGKIRRSQQRIQNLGYFRNVQFEENQGSQPDLVRIRTDVEEQPTGGLFFGLGYSTGNKFSSRIRIDERNLIGTGRRIGVGFSIASSSNQLDFSYTQPYFIGRPLLVGTDVFRTISEFDTSGYNRIRTGVAVRAGYDLGEYTRHVLRYSYRITENDVQDVSKVPSSITDEDLKSSRSGVSQTLTYDRRDSSSNPTTGRVIEFFSDITGLGGDIRYVRSTLSAAQYFPIRRNRSKPARSVFWVRGELGVITGIGQNTTSSDRFYLGGTSFRGFDFSGIGPREVKSDDVIGGKYYYKATAQLDFPLGLPEELDIRGFLFSDAGSLWGYDTSATETIPDPDGSGPLTAQENAPLRVLDGNNLRLTLGGGFFWRSPLGPLGLTWSRVLSKEPYDEPQNFLFSVGTEF